MLTILVFCSRGENSRKMNFNIITRVVCFPVTVIGIRITIVIVTLLSLSSSAFAKDIINNSKTTDESFDELMIELVEKHLKQVDDSSSVYVVLDDEVNIILIKFGVQLYTEVYF